MNQLFFCEVDLSGVGFLDIVCKFIILVKLGVNFVLVGKGILEIFQNVILFCVQFGCEIFILIFSNFILGLNFIIRGGIVII